MYESDGDAEVVEFEDGTVGVAVDEDGDGYVDGVVTDDDGDGELDTVYE